MKQIIVILILIFSTFSFSQEGTDSQLAQFYFNNGEFEKALPYCQKVFTKENSKFNFKRLYECLVNTSNNKDAEKILKKQIAANRDDFEYPIILADFYEKSEKPKESLKVYKDLIDEFAPSSYTIIPLYQALRQANKNDFAFEALTKARKTLKNDFPLNIQFAEMYLLNKETDKMIEEYLNLLESNSSTIDLVQNSLSRYIDFSLEENKEIDLLKEKLLTKIQKRPNDFVYSEMLIWLLIQKKQFNSAIIQAQALDKREMGDGYRVLEIGNMCLQNKNYEAARLAYKYVISLGEDKQFYYPSEYALLNSRYVEISEQRNYSQEEIQESLNEFNQVLTRLGISRSSVEIVKQYAHILAFYGNDAPKAVETLKQTLALAGLTSMQTAELKMLLADIYVIQDDIWESSLLYMQVDKEFKFEPIGFEAKFKNARIFYYDGDFKFAQSQLDILKQSTTKLIANDAMKLSILITDNYGLDSNFTAMSKFAQADLLLEQHQYDKAFELYDTIIKAFPYHGLSDEILLRKAQAMQQQGKWNEAVVYLNDLLKYHAQDILADDALFQLGTIYEVNLSDKEKALEMYKKILFEYKGSLYTAEARKRMRLLRGDNLEDFEL
ncbi:MAG: tetratricopeptide repeat protein [Bacteroidota bacterium]